MCMFCRSLFVLFLLAIVLMSFIDLRMLITPLTSSDSAYTSRAEHLGFCFFLIYLFFFPFELFSFIFIWLYLILLKCIFINFLLLLYLIVLFISFVFPFAYSKLGVPALLYTLLCLITDFKYLKWHISGFFSISSLTIFITCTRLVEIHVMFTFYILH